jgi:hypothetical protein
MIAAWLWLKDPLPLLLDIAPAAVPLPPAGIALVSTVLLKRVTERRSLDTFTECTQLAKAASDTGDHADL